MRHSTVTIIAQLVTPIFNLKAYKSSGFHFQSLISGLQRCAPPFLFYYWKAERASLGLLRSTDSDNCLNASGKDTKPGWTAISVIAFTTQNVSLFSVPLTPGTPFLMVA